MWGDLIKNLPALSALGSAIVIVAGGIFSVVQWYDVRLREQKQRRWSDYSGLLAAVGGASNVPGQLAALYQLTEYQEFRHISIRSLQASNDIMLRMNNVNWTTYLAPRVDEVVSDLQQA